MRAVPFADLRYEYSSATVVATPAFVPARAVEDTPDAIGRDQLRGALDDILIEARPS